ncbi:Mucin-19-like protein [Aix galericulata]|nr:Mucin-19-like protein [Aix galericulata]
MGGWNTKGGQEHKGRPGCARGGWEHKGRPGAQREARSMRGGLESERRLSCTRGGWEHNGRPGCVRGDRAVRGEAGNMRGVWEHEGRPGTARGGWASWDPSSRHPSPWQMAKIYGSLTGYEGVKILSIRPAASRRGGARVRRASAVGPGLDVEHEVIFSTVISPDLTEEFQNKTLELVTKLLDTANNQGNCQHDTCLGAPTEPHAPHGAPHAPHQPLRTPPPHLTPSRAPSSALCQQLAPVGYQDYYYALNVSNTLHCVTNCTANTPGTINCNYGECHVTRAGPQCFCQDESLYWYTGSQCSGRVSKVSTGLGVAVTVLLIACITLTVLLVIRSKSRKR